MSKAPEWIYLDGDVEAGDGMFPRCFENPKYASEPQVEYIRADLVQVAVAAALKEAIEIYRKLSEGSPVGASDGQTYHVRYVTANEFSQAILALITPDAQAALDRVKAAERERFSQTPEVRALIYAANAVMHDLHHGNGLEGLYKNRDRLEVALSAFEGDA